MYWRLYFLTSFLIGLTIGHVFFVSSMHSALRAARQEERVSGTVISNTLNSLKLKTAEGERTFQVPPTAVIQKNNQTVELPNVFSGDKAVVELAEDGSVESILSTGFTRTELQFETVASTGLAGLLFAVAAWILWKARQYGKTSTSYPEGWGVA